MTQDRAVSPRSAVAAAAFTAMQELSAVANAADAQAWWPFAYGQEDVPPLPEGTLPPVDLPSFRSYLSGVGRKLDALAAARSDTLSGGGQLAPRSQGQGLVTAMREVPAVFFQEKFELGDSELWATAFDEGGRQEALERLSHNLDIVEGQMVSEIAARYDSFFDASGYIQDVRRTVAALYEQVAAVRSKIHALELETGAATQQSQQLPRRRANMLATVEMLRAVEGVAQAQAALHSLLGPHCGVAVDYAGTIDVLEVLQGVLDNEDILSLDCLRQLPEQLVQAAQAVDDLMMADFLERSKLAAERVLVGRVVGRLQAQLDAASTPRAPVMQQSPGLRPRSAGQEEAEAVAESLLVDAAGLGRAAAWVRADLPAAEPLQEPLWPLVVGLCRMGRLSSAMHEAQAASRAALRDLVFDTVEGCVARCLPLMPDSMTLPAAAGGDGEQSGSSRLQQLSGEQFQGVLQAVLLVIAAQLEHVQAFCTAVNAVLGSANLALQQEAALQDGRECSQAVAEAAAAQWAKLLAALAHGGPSVALRLSVLSNVLATTDVLSSLVREHGARSIAGLRNALHQLCMASLDAVHQRSLSKLTVLLEQEQWTAVQVHPEFQRTVDDLQLAWQQGEEAAPHANGRVQPAAGSLQGAEPMLAPIATGAVAVEAADQAPASGSGAQEAAAEGQPGPDGSAAGALVDPADSANGSPVPRKYTITSAAQYSTAGGPGGSSAAASAASPGASTLVVEGTGYHVVNTQLVLLRLLSDYLRFGQAVPALAAEVAQRALELLKVFNSRTCQLVLGAGAMHVSGLKSITAKHLAVTCQCLDAFIALHPRLAAAFMRGVPPLRHDMLAAGFQRTLQDYIIHHDEIISKLVTIMRERLSSNIKQLPALAETWPNGPPAASLPPPSSFAATNIKQLQILSSVLAPLLLPRELHAIFGRVQLMFSCTLAEVYGLLEPQSPAWQQQLQADALSLLACLRSLPVDSQEAERNLERLASHSAAQQTPVAALPPPLDGPHAMAAPREEAGSQQPSVQPEPQTS